MTFGYDIIGDIHGYADKLESLLIRMDYKINDQGWFEHSGSRQAIFLGDFIDKGPQQKRTLDIVKPMIQSGAAMTVIGNHEFNAICYATKDAENKYIRSHTESNAYQHSAFLDEFPFGSEEYIQNINWFRTLPVFLDLKDIFVIHACPHEDSLRITDIYTDKDNRINSWGYSAFTKESSFFKAIEVLLKGPEHQLPEGVTFSDRFNGIERSSTRIAWWKNKEKLPFEKLLGLRNIPEEAIKKINEKPISLLFNEITRPTFVGHYCVSGEPKPLTDKISCLDYTVTSGGDLVAYRWSGENKLSKKNFVW